MNISRIANTNPAGKTAAKTAQSTYQSCYNTIGTQILNWSQSCRNCILRTAVQFQPGQTPTVLSPVQVTTLRRHSRLGSLEVPNLDRGFGCCSNLEPLLTLLLPRLHTDKFPVDLGDFQLASQRNDFCLLRNHVVRMFQGLQICPHYQIFPMINSMQILRAMIGRTWAGLNAKPQSTWRKRNYPWSNLAKGWASPTLLRSTSGR